MKSKHKIIWLNEVDSTNEEAKRHISVIDNLSVLTALSQTAGRGQRGNSWLSAPGENLTFSIVLKHEPKVKAYDQFVINEIVSLSVVDFLSSYGISARIKWPNDIYVGDRKICGILIEHSVTGDSLSSSIVGIGLNINQRNFNVNLPNPTSMVLSGAESMDIQQCLEEFMDIFKAYVERYLHIKGGYAKIRKMYLAQIWKMDVPAEYIDYKSDTEGRRFTGVIKGISDVGLLLVKDNDSGDIQEYGFKEIGYIL